jgi:hypothetical protein
MPASRSAVAFFVLATSLCYTQSQQPSPTPGKSTKEKEDKATPKNTKAEADYQTPKPPSPTVGNPSTPLASGNQQNAAHINTDHLTTERWSRANAILVTVFTGVLAFLAWRQWGAMEKQAEYMRDALAETMKAADAAKSTAETASLSLQFSEKVFRLTERADVLILSAGLSTPHITPQSKLIVTLKNYGRTRASNLKIVGFVTTSEHEKPEQSVLGPIVLSATGECTSEFEQLTAWMTAKHLATSATVSRN